MRISDCSSDVCSSDLSHRNGIDLTVPPGVHDVILPRDPGEDRRNVTCPTTAVSPIVAVASSVLAIAPSAPGPGIRTERQRRPPCRVALRSIPLGTERFRSEEHTSELQSLMRISYAVFCLQKKTNVKKKN